MKQNLCDFATLREIIDYLCSMNQLYSSKLLENVVNEFSKLPGIGRKTALRMALHLLKQDEESVRKFGQAIDHAILLKVTAQHGRRDRACGLTARVRLLPAITQSSTNAYQSQMQVASVKPNTVYHGRGKEW
jgi:hypothetical protein